MIESSYHHPTTQSLSGFCYICFIPLLHFLEYLKGKNISVFRNFTATCLWWSVFIDPHLKMGDPIQWTAGNETGNEPPSFMLARQAGCQWSYLSSLDRFWSKWRSRIHLPSLTIDPSKVYSRFSLLWLHDTHHVGPFSPTPSQKQASLELICQACLQSNKKIMQYLNVCLYTKLMCLHRDTKTLSYLSKLITGYCITPNTISSAWNSQTLFELVC